MRARGKITSAQGLALLLLFTLACARQGYVAVTVNLGSLSGKVDRLAVSAFDARGDAGPLLLPADGPIATGIPNDSVVAVATPIGNRLTVLITGLGFDGGQVGVGSAVVPSASANTRVTVTLGPPCDSVRDCDPDSVCLGTAACTLGTCQAATNPLASAGAACGPSDGGQCDGNGACLLPYCGTGLLPLPPDEQCDEGVALNGNLPDHCRSDCQLPSCGDGVVDPDAGELCDLGSRNGSGVGCNATCNLFGNVTVVAGSGAAVSTDGIGLEASFDGPGALAVVANGLFVADQLSSLIRRIDLTTGQVATLAGGFDGGGACQDHNGVGSEASFCFVTSLLAYGDGVIVGDLSALRYVSSDGGVSTFAGQLPDGGKGAVPAAGSFSTCVYGEPLGLAFIPPIIYSSTALFGVIQASDLITEKTWFAAAPFGTGQGGGLTSLGGLLYAGDLGSGTIMQVEPDAGTSTQLQFEPPLTNAHGLCTDGRGIYVASGTGISELTLEPVPDGGSGAAGARVSLLAGGPDAGFVEPEACAYDPATHTLYVSDLQTNRIYAIQ